MGMIRTLSPIHIGNGNYYYPFTIYDKTRYSFKAMLQTIENPEILLDKNLLELLTNENRASQISNNLFFQKFQIRSFLVDPNKGLYKVNSYGYGHRLIFECEKTNNQLYIPGSTLKGYITSLAWYDVINKNTRIHDYLMKKIKEKKFLRIEKRICPIQRILICRDIIIKNQRPFLYNCDRFSIKRKTTIPVGIVETINQNISVENIEIVVKPNQKMIEKFKEYKKVVFKSIDENRDLVNNNEKAIEKELVDEIFKRLINLDSWFKDVNNEFVDENIEEEEYFLNSIRFSKVNYEALKGFYHKLKADLKKGKIIIRIGKYTNYFYKSISSAFDNFMKEYKIYSPNRKKTTSDIGSMNIINGRNSYNLVPGYLEIKL